MTTPNNAVLIQGATLKDIERMIDHAVEKRMAEFYDQIKEKSPVLIRRMEAARRLGVSLPTIDQYAKAGFLKAKHLGGRVYFEEAEVEKYQQKTILKDNERKTRSNNPRPMQGHR